VAPDVLDHSDLSEVDFLMALAVPMLIPVVLVSQVPPGYTRPWSRQRAHIYYQVDTIIMDRALERAMYPEQIIIGCNDPEMPVCDAYQSYLDLFACPIRRMRYEGAELCKLAINYNLAKQIETANELALVADAVGASYSEMVDALRGDHRIGNGYIIPGNINQHLKRDVDTVEKLLNGCPNHWWGQPDRPGAGRTAGDERQGNGDDDSEVAAYSGGSAVRSTS
jgi:hypothetical protein